MVLNVHDNHSYVFSVGESKIRKKLKQIVLSASWVKENSITLNDHIDDIVNVFNDATIKEIKNSI